MVIPIGGIPPDVIPNPALMRVSPTGPYDFGQIANGSTADISITVSNLGGLPVSVDSAFLVTGAPFTLVGLPTFPVVLGNRDSFTFILRFSPVSLATFNDTITILADPGTNGSPFTASVTGKAVAGASLGFSPSSPIAFPDTVVAITSAGIVVTLTNNGGLALTLNTIALGVGTNFALSLLPAMPVVMAPLDTKTFTVKFTPLAFGLLSDAINITTTANNPSILVQGTGVNISPIAVISANIKRLLFAFATPPVAPPLSWDAFTHYVAGNKVLYQGISYIALGNSTGIAPPTNDVLWAVLQVGTVSLFTLNSLLLDSAIAGVLIFNGTLWDEPGQEKKLRRIQVYYENYGIFTLTATVSVWRPSISADFFDQKIVTVSAGSALADLSERTMFFDIQIAGEIILLQLSRAASSGPVSITGALPEFEEGGGEKVAGR